MTPTPLRPSRRSFLATVALSALPWPFPILRGRSVPNDTPDYVSPGSAFQSVADPLYYTPVIDHRRYLLTADPTYEYLEGQYGRVLGRDDFEDATVQWTTAAGTVTSDQTVFLKGARSLKLTTPASAGGQAIARKFFQLPADQSVNTFPLIVVEVWFRNEDAHIRDVQLFVRPDDAAQKWEAAVRFQLRQAGVQVMTFQHLDNTGTFQSDGTYVIRDGSNAAGDAWHHVMMCLAYKQGVSGYLDYAITKFDDLTVKPPANTSAHKLSSLGFRESSVDLIASSDDVTGTVVNCDEFCYGDLSNAFQL